MTLTSGTKLGPYEIQSLLGAGGMGEVYRARDTRLGRDVAIKVLPAHLSCPIAQGTGDRKSPARYSSSVSLSLHFDPRARSVRRTTRGLHEARRRLQTPQFRPETHGTRESSNCDLAELLAVNDLRYGELPPVPRARRDACPGTVRRPTYIVHSIAQRSGPPSPRPR